MKNESPSLSLSTQKELPSSSFARSCFAYGLSSDSSFLGRWSGFGDALLITLGLREEVLLLDRILLL